MPFQIHTASGDPAAAAVDLLAIVVTEGALDKQKLVGEIDRALGGALLEQAKLFDFGGKAEQCLDLPTLGKLKARRVLLLGVGAKRGVEAARLRAAVATAARFANGIKAKTVAFAFPPEPVDLRAVAEGIVLGAYRFTKYMTGDRVPKIQLKEAKIYVAKNVRQ